MGLNKLLQHGMNALGIFSPKMILRLVKLILLSSLKRLTRIKIGKANSTLFTIKVDKDLFIYKIYVDDIIFSSTNQSFCDEFRKIMTDRFEMSMMGELRFFLGFQIKQLEDGTFLNQTKYTRDILKKFSMDKAKSIKTPMGTNGHLDQDMGGKSVNQNIYHSIIDSLLYLCASSPDIMFSLYMCTRF
jgi:hypothetical protein